MLAMTSSPHATFVLVVLLLVVASPGCFCFKWHLSDVLPEKKVLTFSERYMFPSRNGPLMLEQGDAYIHVSADVLVYQPLNESAVVSYAVFAATEDHHHDSPLAMCETVEFREKYGYWTSNVMMKRMLTSYVSSAEYYDKKLGLNGTYYLYKTRLESGYGVTEEAWHNVAFQLCPTVVSEFSPEYTKRLAVAKIDGEITFRNPYGFLPGELFGFLPFEGARMVAYVLFGIVYLYFYCRYFSSTLPLHMGVLAVYLVALAEATTWYASYQQINLTGQPYCCPFPEPVVAALVLQIFRQTLSRTLLVVVGLGYGIVRPKLLPSEWVAVVVVTVAYFVAATVAQVSEIVVGNDVHDNANTPDRVLGSEVPELIMDVIFLSWIYLALNATIRVLTEFQQGFKLRLYRQLATTITVFVGLFAVATVFNLLDKSGVIKWPWQWAWAQQVMWEVLNFAVIAAVCIICCPSDNSRMLAYASQLPTDDMDDSDGGGMRMRGTALDDDDDDDDMEYELGGSPVAGGGDADAADGVELSSWRGRLQNTAGGASPAAAKGTDGFSSLPSAADEEFGLKEGPQ
jgi:hypothetical protein